MKVKRLNRDQNKDGCNQKDGLKFAILQQVNVISLFYFKSLQPLKTINIQE